MKLNVTDTKGNPAGEVEVGFAVIEDGKGTQAVHDTVVAHLANRRVRHRVHEDRGRSDRHQPQALAPEGHRARPGRLLPVAARGGEAAWSSDPNRAISG